MVHDFCSLGWNEFAPIKSSTWEPDTGTETLVGVNVSLRDQNQRIVLGISQVAATGFISSASAAPFAWLNFGPSRFGLSNATDTYEMEFLAEDTSGFLFRSLVSVKVNKAGS